MCENHRQKRALLPLGTKPSYYIVLGHSPVIAGLMQVEIMAIICPAEILEETLAFSFHCVKRSMGVPLSIAEGLGQDAICCCLQSWTQQPSHHPFIPHNTSSLSLPLSQFPSRNWSPYHYPLSLLPVHEQWRVIESWEYVSLTVAGMRRLLCNNRILQCDVSLTEENQGEAADSAGHAVFFM